MTTLTGTAEQYHVATSGDDANPGTSRRPLRTIQRAAGLAQPGDTITVHAGTYRERVSPPRGGASDRKRIVYQAARGERVEIKGSEVINTWVRVDGDTWKATLSNSIFGEFNPYADLIKGDWFNRRNRDHHTGAVYLNGEWLQEAAKLEEALGPVGQTPLWFAQVEKDRTHIWAQFKAVDPNRELVEINVRQSVFYPDEPGRNYITVRGFRMHHAATPWAPPTAQQVGLIGTHWSKGWIIEDNIISHSTCSGVTLGKHGDEFDNTSANSAEGYVKTIERGLARGWNRETIGSHIVRNNTISHCEQTGICGSLGAIFSAITGNHIHDIHVRRLFSGAEMGGIKIHAAIDTLIEDNHIHNAYRGLWLDWMAQGTRVSGNLLYDNTAEDIFVEVNHGPFLVENNLFLSPLAILDMSEGGAFAHNLIAGRIVSMPERDRLTPFHPPHSTTVADLKITEGGDHRFYNNLFVGDGTAGGDNAQVGPNHQPRGAGYGLWVYDVRKTPILAAGNVYYHGAKPWVGETLPVVSSRFDPGLKLHHAEGQVRIELNLDNRLDDTTTQAITSTLLGKTRVSSLPYANPDGSAIRIDKDYLGKSRKGSKPAPGPFAAPVSGLQQYKVWP